jgi:hypothetical protein
MAMTLRVKCSMCWPPLKPDIELDIEGPKDLDPQALKERIERAGWTVQFNDDHMDTYCTKKCAE